MARTSGSRKEVSEQAARERLTKLTPAERAVLRLICRSKTTRGIAVELSVSPKTVENHRSNICQKLEITGNNALLRYVARNADHLREL